MSHLPGATFTFYRIIIEDFILYSNLLAFQSS
jgi:hypothetical protein